MAYITLSVLDEYAKILTPSQAGKLYESKAGKKFEKELYENNELSMYLDAYTIARSTGKSKAELALWLNENYSSLMNNIQYKIASDSIEFKTNDRKQYGKLQESLVSAGFSVDTIMKIRDKKF